MQTLRNQAQSLVRQAIDTVLPPRCVVTGDIVENQGMMAPGAWSALDFIADPFCMKCGFPFEFEVDGGGQCASCLGEPPPFKIARAALKYNDASRDIILGFKHADKLHVVSAFVPWLRRAGRDVLEEADVIVPVPLHHRRLLARRYNQAAIIAEALAKDAALDYVPDVLQRVRATPSQGHLTMKERFKNVRRAFAVCKRHKEAFRGKTIVLVDDVFTTGATVGECAKVLMKAGAKAVHVLTLARVVKGEF